MEIRFLHRTPEAAGEFPLIIVALTDTPSLDGPLEAIDQELGGEARAAIDRHEFRGARDDTLHLTASGHRLILIGLGPSTDRTASLRRAASVAARQARKLGAPSLAWYSSDLAPPEIEAVVAGFSAGAWEYRDLKSAEPEKDRRQQLESVTILTSLPDSDIAISRGEAIGAGYAIARRLAMMPGNLCTPDLLAETAADIADRHGMRLTVLGRAEMTREGMGSFLAVAQGTPQDPKLVALEYLKGPTGAQPIVLIGKGLCFDSGGISIKPAQSMEWMKFDMCGAAGVLGAMETIARLELPVSVVGVLGATTNMPSGTAMNPGDVVRSHLGKSIEIINTDAEGRLVLADLLSWSRRFNPSVVIDAATLTGACVIALGHNATGVFSTDAALVAEIVAAGSRAGEPAWPLPLWDEYRELIKSDIADMKNSGGRAAGAISAAMFLKEFAPECPWVHLDIAGTAYSETDLGRIPSGPTGVPVGMFVEFVRGRAG